MNAGSRIQGFFKPVVRTVGQALAVAGAVGAISFFMTRALPGDAAYRIAAGRYGYDMVDSAAAEAVRQELGLNQPVLQQLGRWLADLLQLRLGNSMVSGDPVLEDVAHQLGHTLYLAGTAWGLALLMGVSLGLLAALRPGGGVARGIDTLATLFKASPAFVSALLLSLLLAVHLQWLPVAGHGGPEYVLLPALSVALALSAGLAQVVREQLRVVLKSDYYEFALTKGLPVRAALWRHAARNVAVPVLAYAGVQLVLLIEGIVVVESFFAWPGIGHALVHAIVARDVPMIQATALVMGLLFVLLNAALDALHHQLDPRLRIRNGGVAL